MVAWWLFLVLALGVAISGSLPWDGCLVASSGFCSWCDCGRQAGKQVCACACLFLLAMCSFWCTLCLLFACSLLPRTHAHVQRHAHACAHTQTACTCMRTLQNAYACTHSKSALAAAWCIRLRGRHTCACIYTYLSRPAYNIQTCTYAHVQRHAHACAHPQIELSLQRGAKNACQTHIHECTCIRRITYMRGHKVCMQ